ncbi:hypothetical protein GmHk_15G044258 [Glycine max]|nr:hypothetical protein GmHk_15G044258 [Glycine max]
MASRKRKAPSTPSQEAWERYTDIIVPRKLLPERNVVVYPTEFDEFLDELERRHKREELTDFLDGNIDVAIVKEFYANLYDPEDKSPKQVRVKGHLIKFDEDTLNIFLKTPVVVEEGETLCAYSRFALLRPDPQELAAKLCIPGKGFELNVDGYLMKILRKNMTTHAQTWSNCWNLDDPIITFRGPRKARGKRSEAPSTSATSEAPTPFSSLVPLSSSTHIPVMPPAPLQMPLPAPLFAGPSDFLFTPQMLYSMIQSIHKG